MVMNVYIYIYVYIYREREVYLYMYIQVCAYVYIYMHMNVYIYIYMNIYIYICIYSCSGLRVERNYKRGITMCNSNTNHDVVLNISSKQRDPNPNNQTLIRKQRCERGMGSLIRRC